MSTEAGRRQMIEWLCLGFLLLLTAGIALSFLWLCQPAVNALPAGSAVNDFWTEELRGISKYYNQNNYRP